MLSEQVGLGDRLPPAVASYWERLKLRPAFIRAIERQHYAAIAENVPTTPAPQVN